MARGRLSAFLVTSFLCVFSLPAHAEYYDAKQSFDALSDHEKIEITIGLIATGDFDGLLDFGFTKRYYNSILEFERREGLTADGVLNESEREMLRSKAGSFFADQGFDYVENPATKSKLFVPLSLFDKRLKDAYSLDFKRSDKTVSINFKYHPDGEKSFEDLFDKLTGPSRSRVPSYRKMRNGYFVGSGQLKGRNYYTWMSKKPGGTVGFTLSWDSSWQEPGRRLSILLANTFIPFAEQTSLSQKEQTSTREEEQKLPDNSAAPTPEKEKPTSGTGSAFKVSENNQFLTNYHVAGQCNELFVSRPGEPAVKATLVGSDESNDLALVKADTTFPGPVAEMWTGPAPKIGSVVAVYGFPLVGALSSSGNFVTGNITALAGLGNDSRQFQISAPVQPGNSGGPVVDENGAVVAVVVSKLNALKTAQNLTDGDIPQNVNFAIKGNLAINFLDSVGVSYKPVASEAAKLATPDIAEKVRQFTYLIECRN